MLKNKLPLTKNQKKMGNGNEQDMDPKDFLGGLGIKQFNVEGGKKKPICEASPSSVD